MAKSITSVNSKGETITPVCINDEGDALYTENFKGERCGYWIEDRKKNILTCKFDKNWDEEKARSEGKIRFSMI